MSIKIAVISRFICDFWRILYNVLKKCLTKRKIGSIMCNNKAQKEEQ